MKKNYSTFSKLKNFILFFCLILFYQTNYAQNTEYDWTEKIQLYGHGFSVPIDFTDTEFDYIANTFKIFTVEKRHAYNSYGGSPSTERATIGTAAKLRDINPDIEVLLYWNLVMNYETLYESNIEFGENATDSMGGPDDWVHSYWPTGYEIYNLENLDCQDWWVDSIVKIIEDGDLDGVFLDAGPKAGASGLTDAVNTAVDRVRARIGNDKIVVYNGYRVVNTNLQAGPEMSDHTSGVFIEFFLHAPLDTKEEAALLFDNLTDAYNEGKILLPRGTPSSYLPGVAAEDQFLFSFASFLLFYGPNSYWIYNDGYNKTQGMFDYYPEYYDIATGESLGGPQRNGWVYTREFENYTITVDLENLTASIEAKNSSCPTTLIESENYNNMSGVEIRTSQDTGGGQMVGQIHNGDWCMYSNIDLTCATNVEARVASFQVGGDIEVRIDSVNGTLIGTISQGTTGGWQDWVTASTNITEVNGVHDVYLVFTGGSAALFNFNWLQFSNNTLSLSADKLNSITNQSLQTYPNPAASELNIQLSNSTEASKVDIFNTIGQIVITTEFINKNHIVDISKLPIGIYVIKVTDKNTNKILTKKFIKK